MSIKRTDLIDGYLRGELGEQDLQAFNKELASDPVFSEEVNFQRQVANGLGEFRKAELKARLNAVDLTTPWWEVGHFINPTLIKTTGAIITAAIIGSGVYYYSSMDEEVPQVQTVDVKDLRTVEVLDADQPVERPEIQAKRNELVVTNKPVAKVISEKSSEELESEASSALVEESSETKEVSTDEFLPAVSLPNPGSGADDSQFKTESVEIPTASKRDIINTNQLDIKTTQRNNEAIRYKYYDGKLHLYGNFKETPYEILEINGVDSKMVYLYHNNKYFKLQSTDKVINLPQITDQKLIRELEIVRNNKVD